MRFPNSHLRILFGLVICALALTSASCSESSGPDEADVAGTYLLVSIAGEPATNGAVVLTAGGAFTRYTSTNTNGNPTNSGVYALSGNTITLDLTNEPQPSLRTTTGTINNGTLEYVPHYQNKLYKYRR